MQCYDKPTYSVTSLREMIPVADDLEIKGIFLTLKSEAHLYPTFHVNELLLLISRRVLELSKTKSPAYTWWYAKGEGRAIDFKEELITLQDS